jgi:hypothetical protein
LLFRCCFHFSADVFRLFRHDAAAAIRAPFRFAATIFRHQTRLPLSAYRYAAAAAVYRRAPPRCFSPAAAAFSSFRRRYAAATLRHAMLIAD